MFASKRPSQSRVISFRKNDLKIQTKIFYKNLEKTNPFSSLVTKNLNYVDLIPQKYVGYLSNGRRDPSLTKICPLLGQFL